MFAGGGMWSPEKARLAAIVESSDDAIVSTTLSGVIQSWNAAAERIFGFTAAEAIGQPVAMLMPPDLREEEHAILQKLRAGVRIVQHESKCVTRAGAAIDVSLTISPLRDAAGRLVGAARIQRDISEQKRAEAEARFQAQMLDTVAQAAIATRPDGTIIYFGDKEEARDLPEGRWFITRVIDRFGTMVREGHPLGGKWQFVSTGTTPAGRWRWSWTSRWARTGWMRNPSPFSRGPRARRWLAANRAARG